MPLESNVDVAPAEGKLGILLPGMGAVGTTLIAGVLAIRKGLAKPIGSLRKDEKSRLRFSSRLLQFNDASSGVMQGIDVA